jgi:cation transport ATPase
VRRAADSAAARLVRLIEDAQAQRSPTELIVDRFAKIYTPLVVLAALLLVRPPPRSFGSVTRARHGVGWLGLTYVAQLYYNII